MNTNDVLYVMIANDTVNKTSFLRMLNEYFLSIFLFPLGRFDFFDEAIDQFL